MVMSIMYMYIFEKKIKMYNFWFNIFLFIDENVVLSGLIRFLGKLYYLC